MRSIEDLAEEARRSDTRYVEFLRVPAMSAGVYVLPAGAIDEQTPHTEDEVYFVAAGLGQFTSDDDSRQVRAGAVLFVPALRPHRFQDIVEELVLLVIFAPAERPST